MLEDDQDEDQIKPLKKQVGQHFDPEIRPVCEARFRIVFQIFHA
jgi:hypothetical protein